MVYDTRHSQVVLFGGVGTNGLFNDTWVWDGVGPKNFGALATRTGADRDYLLLCPVCCDGGTTHALIIESSVMTAFLVVAVAGFRRNLWMVVAALVGHGVFDFFHGGIVTNGGVPEWWPAFCLAYDVCAGGYLAWLLMHSKATPPIISNGIAGMADNHDGNRQDSCGSARTRLRRVGRKSGRQVTVTS